MPEQTKDQKNGYHKVYGAGGDATLLEVRQNHGTTYAAIKRSPTDGTGPQDCLEITISGCSYPIATVQKVYPLTTPPEFSLYRWVNSCETNVASLFADHSPGCD